jgi:hypothetical protein
MVERQNLDLLFELDLDGDHLLRHLQDRMSHRDKCKKRGKYMLCLVSAI